MCGIKVVHGLSILNQLMHPYATAAVHSAVPILTNSGQKLGLQTGKTQWMVRKGLKANETTAGHLESTLKWTNYQEPLHTGWSGSINSRLK